MSVENVVWCQAGFPASARQLVRKTATECGVSEFDFRTSTIRRPRPNKYVEP